MEAPTAPEKKIAFAADRTLGKLVKWLRILGFDTLYDSRVTAGQWLRGGASGRILLTRTRPDRHCGMARRIVRIHCDRPHDQLREVIDALALSVADLHPFSRCSRCNMPVTSVDKASVQGRVPDYIWETAAGFGVCRGCDRVYWAGSHAAHIREMIGDLFAGN